MAARALIQTCDHSIWTTPRVGWTAAAAKFTTTPCKLTANIAVDTAAKVPPDRMATHAPCHCQFYPKS